MIIKSCKFVEASQIFKDCQKAWDIFVEGEPNCTWGDNNRSLVTPDVILNFFDYTDCEEDELQQVEVVKNRLGSLENTYVDLEN